MSYEQIRSAILKRQESLQSIKVTYDLSTEVPAGARDNDPPLEMNLRLVFVLSGERRYLRCTDLNGAQPETTTSFDGTTSLRLRDGSAFVTEGKDRNCEDFEHYCAVILNIPYRDPNRVQRDNSWRLQHALDAYSDSFRLRPKQESVDGAWCDVLEGKCQEMLQDVLWVDAQLGYAWRRRIIYRCSCVDISQSVTQRQLEKHARDFLEVVEGIWLPTNTRVVAFQGPANGGSEEPCHVWKTDVLEMSINQVKEADFQVEIPPGTRVFKRDYSFVVPGRKAVVSSEFTDLDQMQ